MRLILLTIALAGCTRYIVVAPSRPDVSIADYQHHVFEEVDRITKQLDDDIQCAKRGGEIFDGECTNPKVLKPCP